jgi:predicted lipid-binding transport protein (Tim44 family)
MNRRRAWLLFATIVMALALSLDALARPGGGGSFSGGGSSGGGGGGYSSGGGSGGGGFIIALIFNLLPWPVKILVIIGIVVFYFYQKSSGQRMRDWSTGPAVVPQYYVPPPAPMQSAPSNLRRRLADLRRQDPAFSLVLFEDFLYSLYAETRHAIGRGQVALLSAYIAPDVLGRMEQAPRGDVHGVVIGAMRYVDVWGTQPGAPEVRVTVELEVNIAMRAGPQETSAYLVERWTLARKAGAHSRPYARARVLDCPGCGAPLSAVIAGKCTHCQRVVSTGELDWVVREAAVIHEESRAPLLTSDVEEEGTDLPTIVDPDATRMLGELQRRDPTFAWQPFLGRVGLVWSEFQVCWSSRDLTKMRAYLSDNLFQMQSYWVNAYKSQGLRNVSEGGRIEGVELARVESDASYDAVTVRVRAVGLDYTIADKDGKVVAGSKSRPRRYTEYWTLIRGSSRQGPTRTEPVCPNCGAPLNINMAGVCTYCQAKVTTGEFDWVLSRIEQDEVYSG